LEKLKVKRLNSMEVDLETQINHVDMRKMPYINSSKAKVLRPFTRDSARK